MSSAPAPDVPASSDPAPSKSQQAAQEDPAPAPALAQAEETEAVAPAAAPLAADEDVTPDEEEDPTLSEAASSTASLNSSILKYRTENGRTYHSYKDGKYVLPNDEAENDRLDIQHELCILTFDGKLYTCPAGQDKPLHRVLDAGTGTGIWAMDFGDENPNAAVIGVDLSPIQPIFVPPNVSFIVDDLEEPWTYSSKFDFIHARMLAGSIADFPKLFKQSFDHLAPGGWIELTDTVFPLASDDGSVPADSPLARWAQLVLEGSQRIGRPLNSALQYGARLREAGFSNVVVHKYKWPTNAWPRDARMKEMGAWTYHDLCGGIQGLSMALFTRVLGWSTEELELFLVGVRKDFRNRNLHGYFPVWVTYAQKPEV